MRPTLLNNIMINDNNTRRHEGVFWILDDNTIVNNRIILYDFCGHESHSSVWKKLQKIYPTLEVYDYEHFPRGRIWKNKEGSINTYTIFLPTGIDTKKYIDKLNDIFKLDNDFTIETY